MYVLVDTNLYSLDRHPESNHHFFLKELLMLHDSLHGPLTVNTIFRIQNMLKNIDEIRHYKNGDILAATLSLL
jgi:hypothetical protein